MEDYIHAPRTCSAANIVQDMASQSPLHHTNRIARRHRRTVQKVVLAFAIDKWETRAAQPSFLSGPSLLGVVISRITLSFISRLPYSLEGSITVSAYPVALFAPAFWDHQDLPEPCSGDTLMFISEVYCDFSG